MKVMQKLMKKIVASIVGLSMVVMMMPGVAQGLTATELQAQIDALMAQLTELQAQLAVLQGGTTTITGCTITSFDRNLKQTMTGDDVKCLQIVLNTASDTQVASSGAGSPGGETSYFGPLTKAAVIKFQEKYASEVLASWGLTTGTGFVGTTTRAKLNTLLSGGVVPTPTPTPTGTPIPGSGLTVTLAVDNPATSTLVSGAAAANYTQALAPLLKVTFANGDSSEVKITQLKLKRLGVSTDSTLSSIYLFEGATRLTDGASVSSGTITFTDTTGLVKVPAAGTKTVTVMANIAIAMSGQTVGVGVDAVTDVVSTASAVNGTFPLNGNLMSIASANDLAGVNFNVTTSPAANVDITAQNDYAVWQNMLVVTTRAVNLSRISFRQIGTIASADLQNFRLYVDGVQAGSTVANLDSNGYVTFDLSAAPKRLEAGTRTVKVLADIIGGANRNFSFSLRTSADVNATDTQYGVNILAKRDGATFTACSTGTVAIGAGTLLVEKTTDSPSGNIVNGATNAVLGKFKLTAAGEKVKIETLYVSAIVSDVNVGYLRNGMLLANGVQVGSTSNLYDNGYTTQYTTFNLGSSLIVEPGSPVTLEVRADIFDADGNNHLSTDDTITVRIEDIGNLTGNNNATGMVSLTVIDVPAAGQDEDGNQLTVKEGALNLSKFTAFADYTYSVPLTAAKLAHFTLSADTTESVNINTINVDIDQVSGAFSAAADLTNLYVVYGDQTTNVRPTVTATDNSWAINYVLAAGSTINVVVYANVALGAYAAGGDADLCIVDMFISGVTTDSATQVDTGAEKHGQTITFSEGTITSALDAGTPVAQIVSGSSAADIAAGTYKIVTAAKFKFTALVDNFTIKEVKVKLNNADATTISGAILNAILKDGDTILANKPLNETSQVDDVGVASTNSATTFTGLSVSVPGNTTKVLTVDLALSVPSADVSTSQVDAAITLDSFKRATSQGVETTDYTDREANTLYVYKSIPTFTVLDLPSGQGVNLKAGSVTTLYKFRVAADAKGEIALKQLKFNIAITDGNAGGDEELNYFKLFRGTTDLTTNYVTIQNVAGTGLEGTTTIGQSGTNEVVVTFDAEEKIPAGQSYEYTLKATPSGFTTAAAGSDTVSTGLLGDAAGHNTTHVFVLDPAGTGSIHELATDNATGDPTPYNVIWSDVSSLTHSYTTLLSSNDWANGYLVLDLPLDSVGIAAQ